MVEPSGDGKDGAPSHIHVEKKKKLTWLPWLLLALAILALLLGLSRCNRHDETAAAPAEQNAQNAAAGGNVAASTPGATQATALAGTSGLGAYLAGNDPVPGRFVFEKLNFDTGKSDLRPSDVPEVEQVAAALKEHPNARISIAGYADSRGSDAANIALGKARADSIKSALVDKGIDAGRIETNSGGEQDPVDTNATESGRFQNRRTELVVTAR